MAETITEVVTIDDQEFWQWKAVVRVPKNWTPESGCFIAIAPPGGIANIPALVQGDTGFTPTIRNANLTELAHDDPTPASAEWTLVTPGTSTTAPVFDLDISLHKGEPGDDGSSGTLLGASDFDDTGIADGLIFAINSTGDGVELVSQKVGNMYWPTSFASSLSNASGGNTVGTLTIPPQDWDWRPRCHGQALVTYDGTDVRVDAVVRLNNATTGDVVARGKGPAGTLALWGIPVLSSAPPAGSLSTYGVVSAGASATIYYRLEQVGSGTSTFDALNSELLFAVEVAPLQ